MDRNKLRKLFLPLLPVPLPKFCGLVNIPLVSSFPVVVELDAILRSLSWCISVPDDDVVAPMLVLPPRLRKNAAKLRGFPGAGPPADGPVGPATLVLGLPTRSSDVLPLVVLPPPVNEKYDGLSVNIRNFVGSLRQTIFLIRTITHQDSSIHSNHSISMNCCQKNSLFKQSRPMTFVFSDRFTSR